MFPIAPPFHYQIANHLSELWALHPGDGLQSYLDQLTTPFNKMGHAIFPHRLDLVPAWLRIGRKNFWISQAVDPPFTTKSFCFCSTYGELAVAFAFDNWSLGQAFTLGPLCFIEQSASSSEYLVIRNNLSFESLSAYRVMVKGELIAWIESVLRATDDQLESLEYKGAPNEH